MAHTTDNDAFFARLFSGGQPREVDLDAVDLEPADDTLLWIDLDDPPDALLDRIWQACGFPAAARAFVDAGTTPEVGQEADWFWVRSVVVVDEADAKEDAAGSVLVCVAGRDRVLSVRRRPVPFLDAMRNGDGQRVALGQLSAESFVATLLDRQLSTYFQAVNDYEMAIERLEVAILARNERRCLHELQRLRRWSSRLRRMLASHRNVFSVMSRPDFRPGMGHADQHFAALDNRYERAMDVVENARELVIGSFELFSNQTALRTNDFMRVLTFVTVVTGVLATIVGALGMNFQAGLFESRDAGFWTVVGGLLLLAGVSLALGKRRGWF